jgi:hypothetical protein
MQSAHLQRRIGSRGVISFPLPHPQYPCIARNHCTNHARFLRTPQPTSATITVSGREWRFARRNLIDRVANGSQADQVAETSDHPHSRIASPGRTGNSPLILRAPSYVMSTNRLTTPSSTTKRQALPWTCSTRRFIGHSTRERFLSSPRYHGVLNHMMSILPSVKNGSP